MTPLLSVTDLTVAFDTEDGVVHAVDGMSLDVAAGAVLGVVGESGSGKTVSALTLLGLTRSKYTTIAGSAIFEGRDLLTMPDAELRRLRGNDIAMIFQDPLSALHPLYTIGRQLTEAVLAHRDVSKTEARDRAVAMLSQVGVPDALRRLDSHPHELSGGTRQRVMIAMALVNEPKLLIADEPTTALDVTVQAQILELLMRLREDLGMAMVLVTHDLGVVAAVADEIAVMYAGRVVERASTDAIFADPEHPYTWGLLRSIPRLDAESRSELVPIPGRPPSLITRPSGCHFHPRCPYVREAHTTTDPALVPTADDADHLVRCLLPQETRRRVWAELRSGADPEQARERVGLDTLARPGANA
jgi:peptide/nickel transport system ATP-binding protein